MLKRIKADEWFTKNLGWKIFSVALATCMWLIVMTTQTPYEYKTFTTSLTLLNKDVLEKSGLVILNQKELEQSKIQIKVYAQRPALTELSKLENKKLITAKLNVENFDILYAKDISAPITASITASVPTPLQNYDIEVVTVSPNATKVQLDRLVSATKAVTVDRIGEPKKGYVAMQPVVKPENIIVTGAESQIKRISSVRVPVDLTNATYNVTSQVKPVIYDEYNNEMTTLSFNTAEVSVLTVINKQSNISVVKPTIVGSPASGYAVVSMDWEPKTVTVVGPETDLNSVKSIVLPNVDITGLTQTTAYPFDLRKYLLSTALNIINGKPTEAKVTVTVEKELEQTYLIAQKDITVEGLPDGYTLYLPEAVPLTLVGLESAFKNFDIDDVKAKVDASALALGTNKIDVSFTLPEGIAQTEPSSINVLVANHHDDDVPAVGTATPQP